MPKDENAPKVEGHCPGNEKSSTILVAEEDFNNENWNKLWVKQGGEQGIRF